jgi:flagellar hook-length control protein FliK
LVRDARSASSVPQTGAKAQKAAKAETQAFENVLQEQTLASAAKAHRSKNADAGAEDGAAPSDPAQTGQTQPAAAGLAFLAAPSVLAALDNPKGEAAASSAKSGGSTALDASALKSASQAVKGLAREKSGQASVPLTKPEPSSKQAGDTAANDAPQNVDSPAARNDLAAEPSFALSRNTKADAVSAVVVNAKTHLAPGAPLTLSDSPAGELNTAYPTAVIRPETGAAAIERSVAAPQPNEKRRVDTARADGAPANATPVAGASASTLRQTEASRPIQEMDSASAANETEASRPVQVTDFARGARQGTTQDGGSNKERSSGKDQSSAAAQPPLEANSVIPVSSGSVSAATPSQQIAQAVEAAMPPAINAPAQADGTPTAPANLQPVKTIALALSPQNLGGVEIELSLTGGKLDVKIRAAEPETAKLLRRDDAALEKLFQSAGFSLQGLSIQVAQQAAQSSQTGAQPNNQGSADSSTANGGRDQGARQGSGEKPADKGSDRGSTNGRASVNRRGGSLYL